jgi:4-alpha-glucanotransferase
MSDLPPRLPVLDRRRAGVLLHPSALVDTLPGGPASGAAPRGALGAAARAFIDWLAAAGCSVWQVLPLGPVGEDGSPYWVRSDHAGRSAFIDLEEAPDPVGERADYEHWCAREAHWLEDYVLFMALSQSHARKPWWQWQPGLAQREPAALAAARARLATELEALRVAQWQFARQWSSLREYAHARGVRLFGDLPIYLAPDSVATWAARAQFQLAADGQPAALAGVPPDYFSADGQLWGNPLYDWTQARRDGFAFWRARFASQLARFDLVRIDHFRGLAGFWSVPAGARTAREGQWVPAPGNELLAALRSDAGDLPVVAEDLGLITPDVDALRHGYALPGMRVLQFGFDGSAGNPHLAYNYSRDTVAYTGTHDNDTTRGWYDALDPDTAARVALHLACGERGQLHWAAIRAVLSSVAVLAIVPLQDVLGLGAEARFNVPGTVGGNWGWRAPAASPGHESAATLRALVGSYGRLQD